MPPAAAANRYSTRAPSRSGSRIANSVFFTRSASGRSPLPAPGADAARRSRDHPSRITTPASYVGSGKSAADQSPISGGDRFAASARDDNPEMAVIAATTTIAAVIPARRQ